VVLGGVGFAAASLSGGSVDSSRAASAAMPIDPGDQPLGSPVPKEAAPLEGGGYKISAAEDAKFKAEEAKEEEAQRQRVAAALAAKPAEEPKPARKNSGSARRPQKQSGSSAVQKSGSKFDPLNGALP
jgi:hypothetical protein